MNPLVSIIMPAFNAEKYISDAIQSVLGQSYEHWELLVVNDGSTDQTLDEITRFGDDRIRCFDQTNKGVSAARNRALKEMKGELFCFLDADDTFLEGALRSRVEILVKSPETDFVDGKIVYVDKDLKPIGRTHQPSFQGTPKNRLLRLDQACLFGNTWMIRKRDDVHYHFNESLTHAEDLFFYLSICFQRDGGYSFTSEAILNYRQNPGSAMTNLKGLEDGYFGLIKAIRAAKGASGGQLVRLKLRIMRIMFLSHLIDGKNVPAAIWVLPKFVLA